jgi:hypothetical protein
MKIEQNPLAWQSTVRHEPRTDEDGNKILYHGTPVLILTICFAIIFACAVVGVIAGIASNYEDSLSDAANILLCIGLFLVFISSMYFTIAAVKIRIIINNNGVTRQGPWPFRTKVLLWNDIAKISYPPFSYSFVVHSRDGTKMRIPLAYYGIHRLVGDFKAHLSPDVYQESRQIIETINFLATNGAAAVLPQTIDVAPVPMAAQTADGLSAYVNNAKWEKGKRLSMTGLISLFGGLGITLATLYFARNGGTYWIMWGLVLVGPYYLISGIVNMVKSNAAPALRRKWVLGSVAGLVVLAAAGTFGYMQITALTTPPDDSVITVDDQSEWLDFNALQYQGNFIVYNTDTHWSISDAVMQIIIYDADGKALQTFEIPATPDVIAPGGTGIAKEVLQIPAGVADSEMNIGWTWVAP